MKALLINYNYTPTWLLDSGLDYWLWDRSDSDNWLVDFPKDRILKRKNIGNVDLDKLTFLVDSYDNLPDVFLWGKSNLFKYVDEESLKKAIEKAEFAPLLKQDHKTYADKRGAVCYYEDRMYHERNDSWYLSQHYSKYFSNFNEWLNEFGLKPQSYIPFPPGGNFILTRERVHRYGKHTYEKMRDLMDYTTLPGEAQMAERTYYLMWK